MRRLLKLIALLLPLGWIVLVAFIVKFSFFRDRYEDLWEERHQMIDARADRSSTGKTFREIYDDMQEAEREYLLALEGLAILGIFPAFFVYFLISLSTLRSRR